MSLPDSPFILTHQSASVKQLHEHLTSSLQLRVLEIPLPTLATTEDARVAVLFSGGLDCTVLARLASDLVPTEQPIDLLNVAFENPRIAAQNSALSKDELYELCPDRVTGRKSFAELVKACPARCWRLVAVCASQSVITMAELTISRSTFLMRIPANIDQTSFASSILITLRWISQSQTPCTSLPEGRG